MTGTRPSWDRPEGGDKNRLKSVDTAFTIIERLYGNGSIGVSALADELDMPKSTVHIYLNTLSKNGYVVKEDGEYRIGYRFLYIGGDYRDRQKFFQVSRPVLDSLANETKEMADLMVEENGMGVLLYKAQTSDSVDDNAHIGQYFPLHCTAMGKAILANLPSTRVDEIIDRHGLDGFTPSTITSRSALTEELAAIRKAGLSFNNEERTRGVRAIGAPLVCDDKLVGAISVSGPTARIDEEYLETDLADSLLQAQNVIELRVSHY